MSENEVIEICEKCDSPIYEQNQFVYDISGEAICLECMESITKEVVSKFRDERGSLMYLYENKKEGIDE